MPETETTPLDVELLDEQAELGIEDLRDLIDLYLTQADEIMGELHTAIRSDAAKDVDQLAHKLAGSSAVCGANAMVAPLRSLEQRGREGKLAGADALYDRIAEQLEWCRRLLAEYLEEKSGKHRAIGTGKAD